LPNIGGGKAKAIDEIAVDKVLMAFVLYVIRFESAHRHLGESDSGMAVDQEKVKLACLANCHP
jgi:hypothetical protein